MQATKDRPFTIDDPLQAAGDFIPVRRVRVDGKPVGCVEHNGRGWVAHYGWGSTELFATAEEAARYVEIATNPAHGEVPS